MKDAQTVVSVLQRFRDMGVSVAIDDFAQGIILSLFENFARQWSEDWL